MNRDQNYQPQADRVPRSQLIQSQHHLIEPAQSLSLDEVIDLQCEAYLDSAEQLLQCQKADFQDLKFGLNVPRCELILRFDKTQDAERFQSDPEGVRSATLLASSRQQG